MSMPYYESLMPSVLELAQSQRSISEAVQMISDQLELTEEERAVRLESGSKTLIKSRIEWALTYLVQAGLVRRPQRGRFLITDRGRVALSDGSLVNNQYLRKYPEFVDFLNRSSGGTRSAPHKLPVSAPEESAVQSLVTPEEQIDQAQQMIDSELRDQLLDRILDQSPAFFEQLVVSLLSAMGYGNKDYLARAVGRVGDGGIDGVIHQDKLGLDAVFVQAKRYARDVTVGRPELQAFIGALSGFAAQKGVFFTTSKFSTGALDYLRNIQQRVVTIDGERLVSLMMEHDVGVRPSQVIVIKRIDEDFFIVNEDDA